MCEKCVKLNARIDDYRDLARHTADKRALVALGSLIEECEAEKVALHLEPERIGGDQG